MQYTWLSAHIFYSGSAEEWLHGFIKPFIEKIEGQLHPSAPFFYIRYGEGGPHIRLRLQLATAHLPAIKVMLEHNLSAFSVSDPIRNASDKRPGLLQHSYKLEFIPYLPETSRYGNEDTIVLAERHFFLSSRYCLQSIFSQPEWHVSAALATAFQMHIAFFYALQADISTVKKICEQFIQAWLGTLTSNMKSVSLPSLLEHMNELFGKQSVSLNTNAKALWQSLEAGCAPLNLQQFAGENLSLLKSYREAGIADDQFYFAIRSLLHMTHNRLGISNKEEPWCIYIIHRCLQHVYENVC